MGHVPLPSDPLLSPLHACHPPGNLAAKVSTASAEGPESFAPVLRGEAREASHAFDELLASGHLIEPEGPGVWAYRIVQDGMHSLGLVAALDRADGEAPSPLAAHRRVEPAIATVRANLSATLLELMRSATTERPLFHFKAADGLTHTGWTVADRAAAAAELASLRGVECLGPSPARCIARILPPEIPAFPPRFGLFVRKLEAPAAGSA